MKSIYFTYGLPRSGNTLLGSILNQNPKVNVTSNSILPEVMFCLNNIKAYDTNYNNFPDESSIDNLLKSIFDVYYKDWKGDYIIERGVWITPCNFTLLERYFEGNIKIVILVRNVLDVIKSYLHLCAKDPNFYINLIYNQMDPTTTYRSEVEEKCDLIMQKGETVDKMLYSIKWFLDSKNRDCLHFVEYKDLVKDPKATVNGVYDFLGIKRYKHRFINLEQFSINGVKYNDDVPGTAKDMHTIRTEKINDTPHSTRLPDSVIHKYSNLEFWR